MPSGKASQSGGDPLPDQFRSIQDFWSFWDGHSTADYEAFMEEAGRLKLALSSSKVYCPVSRELAEELRSLARREGISTESLINRWLDEKIKEATSAV